MSNASTMRVLVLSVQLTSFVPGFAPDSWEPISIVLLRSQSESAVQTLHQMA